MLNLVFNTRTALNKHTSKYHNETDISLIPKTLSAKPKSLQNEQPIFRLGPTPSILPSNDLEARADLTATRLADLKLEEVPDTHKQKEENWDVVYNPIALRQISLQCIASIDNAEKVECVRFSPDSQFVVIPLGCSLIIVKASTGEVDSHLRLPAAHTRSDEMIKDVQYSPCGKFLACAWRGWRFSVSFQNFVLW